MRILLSLFLPFVTFISLGRPFAALFALLFQLSIVLWPVATMWALYAVKPEPMRLFFGIFFPFVAFFTIGRPLAGFICLILQMVLIGWIPAALWAVYSVNQFETDRKLRGY